MSEITKVCEALVEQGVTPSVGLVRAKLSKKFPLPEIISGIKAFQQGQAHIIEKRKEPTTKMRVATLELRVAQQAEKINEMTEELDILRFMIKQLSADRQTR